MSLADRQAKATELVSLGLDGPADGFSTFPAISADGTVIAFTSSAANLVSGDANGQYDVFIRDRSRGVTERVSVKNSGAEGNRSSHAGAISNDGNVVAYYSDVRALVSGDTNDATDVFVHDRRAGTNERVSVSSSGGQADAGS